MHFAGSRGSRASADLGFALSDTHLKRTPSSQTLTSTCTAAAAAAAGALVMTAPESANSMGWACSTPCCGTSDTRRFLPHRACPCLVLLQATMPLLTPNSPHPGLARQFCCSLILTELPCPTRIFSVCSLPSPLGVDRQGQPELIAGFSPTYRCVGSGQVPSSHPPLSICLTSAATLPGNSAPPRCQCMQDICTRCSHFPTATIQIQDDSHAAASVLLLCMLVCSSLCLLVYVRLYLLERAALIAHSLFDCFLQQYRCRQPKQQAAPGIRKELQWLWQRQQLHGTRGLSAQLWEAP
jgi:hypothetical protein